MFEMVVGGSPFHIVESFVNSDQSSTDNLLQVILERKVHILHCHSVKAAAVLESFLIRDPKEGLCCHPQTRFSDVQEHPLSRRVDWDMMEQKQVVPPFRPNISGEFSLDKFDPQFTNEPGWLTPDNNDLRNIDRYEFVGFESINHLLMYGECVGSSFFNHTLCYVST